MSLLNHFNLSFLLPLQVILPIGLSLSLIIVKSEKNIFNLTYLILFIGAAISFLLLYYIIDNSLPSLSYYMGGFKAPIGIEYRATPLISLLNFIISIFSLLGFIWAKPMIKKEILDKKIYIFNIFYVVYYAAIMGITISGDLFNIFVFLEILSIANYIIISMNNNKSSMYYAFNYLVIATIATSFYLISIALIYSLAGSLNLLDVLSKVQESKNSVLILSFVFMSIFILIKTGIFPFSSYYSTVYKSSPYSFLQLFSSTGSQVLLVVSLKIFLLVFYHLITNDFKLMYYLILILSLLGLFLNSIYATHSSNLKEILSWSSVAQISYILLGFTELNREGILFVFLILINQALTKTGLFMISGNFYYAVGNTKLSNLKNIQSLYPFNFLILIILLFNLIGFPGTFGFTVKWKLLYMLYMDHMWFSLFIMIVSSIITLIYSFKIFEACYSNNSEFIKPDNITKIPNNMNLAVMFIAMIVLTLSLTSGNLIDYINVVIATNY